jgi:methylmalonyl-CoA/ethylmalonyl-CoA epimerase
MGPHFGAVRQLGYVVESVDRAVEAWSTRLSVGPWTIIRNVVMPSVYLGTPSEIRIDVALSYRGDTQIELIQQTNHAPSPYRPFIESGQFGLHHVAFLCEDINGDVARAEAAELKLVCDIRMPTGGRYVYFASPVRSEQTFIELLEATATMKQMFELGVPAAAKWDGTGKPVVIDMGAVKRP